MRGIHLKNVETARHRRYNHDSETPVIGEVPWALVGIVIIVALLGVYNLHSAAHSKDPDLFLKQLTWLGIGLGLAAALQFRTIEPLSQSLTSHL